MRLECRRAGVVVALLPALGALLSGGCKTGGGPAPSTPQPGPTAKSGEGPALAPAPLTGGPAAMQEPVRVALLVNALTPFWRSAQVGMERAAKALGIEAEFRGPDGPSSVSAQVKALEELANKGVQGICLSPLEPKPLTEHINRLVEKGIVVLTMDSDAPESKRYGYVGTDNVAAGRVAGEEAAKVWPNGAQVIIFVGIAGAQNAKERIGGFREVAGKHNIEVLEVLQDNADSARCKSNAEDALQRYPDVDGFIGIWSYNAPQLARVLEEKQKLDQVKIVCFDAEPLTQEALAQGQIEATIVQKPFDFGYLGTTMLYSLIMVQRQGGKAFLPDDAMINTGVRVITPQNIADFRQELADLGVESS